MATDKEIYEALCGVCSKQMPGFQVKFKDKSFFMKFLAFFMKPFCPDYMTRYTTTFGMSVYFPDQKFVEEDYGTAWKILAHELVHGMDYRNSRIWFVLSYGFPPLMAAFSFFALGAFWNLWFLLALLSLIALAPWPAYWRTKWEMRGYTMSMAVNFWRYKSISEDTKDWIITGPLTGWGYYKMCWSKKRATEMVGTAAARISDGSILNDPAPNPYKEVHDLLKSLNATK